MEEQELVETTGGVVWWIPLAAGAAAVAILKDWSDFKQGVVEGWKAYN
jgi:hypothetical protein